MIGSCICASLYLMGCLAAVFFIKESVLWGDHVLTHSSIAHIYSLKIENKTIEKTDFHYKKSYHFKLTNIIIISLIIMEVIGDIMYMID